jgi:hypothetical protein
MVNEEIDKIILEIVKKEFDIVYGAQSIKKQIGFLGRETYDWDIFSKNPKQSASKTHRELEEIKKGNQFFVKPAIHKGTYKVMSVGQDNKPKTKDDVGIVDFTIMPKPEPPFKNINGIRYRTISKEESAKNKALRDKTQKFRWEKDQEDKNRIEIKKVIFD